MGAPARTLVVMLCLAGSAWADSLVSLPDPTYADAAGLGQTDPLDRLIDRVVYPTLGCPSLVRRGDTITVLVRLADGGATTGWQVWIAPATDRPSAAIALLVETVVYDSTGLYRLSARVSREVPRDVYDITVSAASLAPERHPVSVRVIDRYARDFQFVAIADNQTRDVRVQDRSVIEAELREIRLISPEFVLFSGDWNFGQDYQAEYAENAEIWARAGMATFMAPGNHDGYATVLPMASQPAGDPPGQTARDGLYHWRTTCGPLYYSFDYGEIHFAAVNSYDGDAKRRNSIGIVVMNYGGEVGPAQLAWLDQDLATADAAGKTSVLFMHHDPRGHYTSNVDAYPFDIRQTGNIGWQQWNDEPNGRAVLDTIARHNVSHVFLGHDHANNVTEETVNQRKVTYVRTASMSMGTDQGYRVVEVRGGRIAGLQIVPHARERIHVQPLVADDGQAPVVTTRVTNGHPLGRDLRLAFLMPAAASFMAQGGTVVGDVPSAAGTSLVHVTVSLAASETRDVTVEAVGAPGTVAPLTAAPPADRAGGEGGGCAAAPKGEVNTIFPIAVLAILILSRARRAAAGRHACEPITSGEKA